MSHIRATKTEDKLHVNNKLTIFNNLSNLSNPKGMKYRVGQKNRPLLKVNNFTTFDVSKVS